VISIRKSMAARYMCWALALVINVPIVSNIVSSRAAAQTPTPSNLQTIVVIDFENKSGVANAAIPRLATDAVAVELANSARYVILTREEVRKQNGKLGLRPPFDKVALSRLARALDANAYLDGEISFVHVKAQSSVKTVEVGLSDTDSLIQEAIGNAAVLGVRSILNSTLPEGVVLSTVGSGNAGTQVLINRGSRDGVTEGMDLIVIRERSRVGRIRITNTFPTDSEARILDNALGIAPQDSVRAVFPMPEFSASGHIAQPVHHESRIAVLGKILLIMLAGLLIATAARGSSNVTGVSAEADIQGVAPAVKVTWRDNLFGGGTLEYHLWRTPGASFNLTGIPVAAIGAGQHQIWDYPTPYTNWNGVNSFLQGPNGTTTGTTGAGLSTAVTPAAGTGPSGFNTGTTYTYQVTALLRRVVAGSGTSATNGITQEDVETGVVTSGTVTPVGPAQLNFPSAGQANINLQSANFVWLSVAGADVFQLELSTDQTFTDRTRIMQLPLVYSTAQDATGATQSPPSPVDLTNSSTNAPLRKDPVFANFINRLAGAATPAIWWRVGARNNADRPGPVNWLTKSNSDSDRSFRFIYSQARSFQPAALPPAPP
jgi:hypothetical protein